MASKQKYECFTCRDNGFPGVLIVLAGKDAQGKAIRVEEDGSAHVHKTKQKDATKLQQSSNLPTGSTLESPKETEKIGSTRIEPTEYEQSVKRGIDAFSMMTDLIGEVEEVKEEIKRVREVLANQERLFNEMLVWTQQINKHLRLQHQVQPER